MWTVSMVAKGKGGGGARKKGGVFFRCRGRPPTLRFLFFTPLSSVTLRQPDRARAHAFLSHTPFHFIRAARVRVRERERPLFSFPSPPALQKHTMTRPAAAAAAVALLLAVTAAQVREREREREGKVGAGVRSEGAHK